MARYIDGYWLNDEFYGIKFPEQPIPELPYLCFTANTAGSTVQLTQGWSVTRGLQLETSTDGDTRTDYAIGDTITLTNEGDKVYMRNKSETPTGFSTGTSNGFKFVMSGSISGSGDINYLLCKNSTTTVSDNCYSRLFSGCTSLTTAPELPATTAGYYCYYYMFEGCTGLTTAPSSLPATTLLDSCCMNMFEGCTGLTTAPKLLATTLGNSCCRSMFEGCTSLTTLPELPATTFMASCCMYMFRGCTNINLSETQTGDYQIPYRMPSSGTGTSGDLSLYNMFANTGGPFDGTPQINTTYYTSNQVI